MRVEFWSAWTVNSGNAHSFRSLERGKAAVNVICTLEKEVGPIGALHTSAIQVLLPRSVGSLMTGTIAGVMVAGDPVRLVGGVVRQRLLAP